MTFDPQTAELEVKYTISEEGFNNTDLLQKFLCNYSFFPRLDITGVDRFFKLGTKAFRIREDTWDEPMTYGAGTFKKSGFTVTIKERTSKDSLTHRKEVDLSIPHSENPEEFFKMLGAIPHYSIIKEYHVWKQHNPGAPELLVATYQVSKPDGSDKRWFLEVEVEKHGNHTLKERLESLATFCLALEAAMKLDKPVNLSLYELYAPKSGETPFAGKSKC